MVDAHCLDEDWEHHRREFRIEQRTAEAHHRPGPHGIGQIGPVLEIGSRYERLRGVVSGKIVDRGLQRTLPQAEVVGLRPTPLRGVNKLAEHGPVLIPTRACGKGIERDIAGRDELVTHPPGRAERARTKSGGGVREVHAPECVGERDVSDDVGAQIRGWDQWQGGRAGVMAGRNVEVGQEAIPGAASTLVRCVSQVGENGQGDRHPRERSSHATTIPCVTVWGFVAKISNVAAVPHRCSAHRLAAASRGGRSAIE